MQPLTGVDSSLTLLQDAFKSCGTVVRAEILQAEGKPKGAGTVLFETADAGGCLLFANARL